jgi:CubicO group peptidase (beta-lactamase class C family)
MTPRQMMAFGNLYLKRGLVNGRQVVPAAWVDASFVPRARSHWSEQLFGYGWWMREMAGRQVYYAWGYGGQFVFIVPDLELVIVTTSVATPGEERRDHLRAIYDLVERLVVGPAASAVHAPLPYDRPAARPISGRQHARWRLRHFARPLPAPSPDRA